MQEQKTINRLWVLFGALLIQTVLGAVYTWSLFNEPLVQKFGWSTGDVVFTFSITMAMFAVGVLLAGRVQDKLGPRKVAIAGGLLAGLGVFLASQATSIMQIYLTYGFMTGLGMGAAYVTPVATCVKWFPERRGFITGLALAAVGVGGMIFTPMILSLIESVGVSSTFMYLGVGYGTAIILGGLLMINPPEGYKPAGWEPPKAGEATTGAVQTGLDFTPGEMIKTPQFYSLFVMYFCGIAAGLMVISIAANIGTELVGLTAAAAGGAVVTISLFNAGGRFGWGAISDKIGRIRSLFLQFIILGVAMLYMSLVPMSYVSYLVVTCAVGFCFGGYLSIFPSVTADWFGTKNVGNNYGLVFMGYGVSALVAPMFAVAVGFTTAFMVAAVLCAFSAVLAWFTKPPTAKA
ncbi:hypothetical protein SYNTR_0073 [Candidatus Syntrophocurvum alkaliphilum]|uniref:Major facilitator superfamily (MFS) profile domain-containing protein n=1 Tax=Candidatus Syntrophocurvum alkaliphilum TaxID=2293317 RepID=A0A6I6D5J7_9FIRM|nr:OFA family MFS transporter [Candidatus Syntrophocurvum alkaliphilum]QGT98666.1 hypothetical protein SYNTR_0073 [Candidatus Syntrophocurvum alkaliphilum]